MAKSPDAFRTISEVATWLGTQAHVLRFWESKFDAVAPVQRTGGRRYYRLEDMLLLGGIKFLLHEQGMTIKVREKSCSKKQGSCACAKLLASHIERPKTEKIHPPRPAKQKNAAPAQNVVDLQFDPVKIEPICFTERARGAGRRRRAACVVSRIGRGAAAASNRSHADAPRSSPRPGIGHRLPGRGCRGQQFPEQRRADNSGSSGG